MAGSRTGFCFRSRYPHQPHQPSKAHVASLLERAGLPADTRFHDLRHTCATLLLGKGVHPKFVQELLGHANIAITLDTYSQEIPDMGDATARAMEDAPSKVNNQGCRILKTPREPA